MYRDLVAGELLLDAPPVRRIFLQSNPALWTPRHSEPLYKIYVWYIVQLRTCGGVQLVRALSSSR